MTDTRVLIIIAACAAVTFFLRALPFIAFGGDRKMPPWLERLGQSLPPAIMAVLLVYCLKDAWSDPAGTGVRELIAVAVTAVSYKLRHSTLLSLTLGTGAYMLLLQIL